MFLSYLNIALRNFWKQRVYTLINILGLSVGIACFIGIVAYTNNELNYDRHHESAENIFRIKLIGDMSGTAFEAAVTGAPVGKILYEELPEVILYTRLIQYPRAILFDYNNKKIYQDGIIYADSSFFSMFSYDLIGDPDKALQEPYSLVFTESAAKKYFGDEDPIGKIIKWDNQTDYTAKAVIKEPIKNTHIGFQVLVSRASLYSNPRYESVYNHMFGFTNINYIKCNNNNIEELNTKIGEVFEDHAGASMREFGANLTLELQPITDIHLKSNITHEIEPNGNITTVYIFIVVAILIILISSINYINLSVANSSTRTLEVGIRKMFGANKKALFIQFLSESIVLVLLSFGLSLLILKLISPLFNTITTKSFGFILSQNINYWQILLLVPVIGIFAGSYPSFYLSSLKPIKILNGIATSGNHKSIFRNSMIIIQFVISIFLLSSTWLIYKQMNYIQNKNLGFKKENTIVASLRNMEMISQFETLKNEMLRTPGVIDISASSSYLGSFNQRRGFYKDGVSRKEMMMILNLQCDDNFLEMMNIELKEGRYFQKDSESEQNRIIVNETLVKEFGIENPIGKAFRLPANEDQADESSDPKLEIIGVCKDFHYSSLHETIKPIIIWKDESLRRYVSIKIDGKNEAATINMISKKWNEIYPDYPFEYFFLQNQYDNLYKADVKVGNVFTAFTILAILIACLGIFGLTSYTTEKRTKEIGIRKVLGANASTIMILITKDYIIPILISAVISIPISWYFIQNWLQNFSYRINIQWFIFFFATLLAFLIAVIAINSKAYFAARKNPVESIRYE
jgi:putative ABC transport system permease protein